MSSYYSQSFQYKLQGGQQSNYLPSNAISGNGSGNNNSSINNNKIASNSKRPNSARLQPNHGSSNNNGVNDVTTYVNAKKMAEYKETGKQSTTYIVQKPSGSTANAYTEYGVTNGTTYNTNKYEMQAPKINSHLLDHGYGATPQPSFDSNSNSDDTSGIKGGLPKSSDAVITSYYKVSSSFIMFVGRIHHARNLNVFISIRFIYCFIGRQTSSANTEYVTNAAQTSQTYANQSTVDQETLLGRN